jgi:hypothetical protein
MRDGGQSESAAAGKRNWHVWLGGGSWVRWWVRAFGEGGGREGGPWMATSAAQGLDWTGPRAGLASRPTSAELGRIRFCSGGCSRAAWFFCGRAGALGIWPGMLLRFMRIGVGLWGRGPPPAETAWARRESISFSARVHAWSTQHMPPVGWISFCSSK